MLHASRRNAIAAENPFLQEIERCAICINYFGFDGIRLTGGEPLVQALAELVERLALQASTLHSQLMARRCRYVRLLPKLG